MLVLSTAPAGAAVASRKANSWGDNFNGELGNGDSGDSAYSNVPVKVADIGTSVRGIAAGAGFSLALLKDGAVRSWGENVYGQLGSGATLPGADKAKPVRVANLSNMRAIATDSSGGHTLASLNDGTVRAWGKNYSGQLGNGANGNDADTDVPVGVKNLTNVQHMDGGGDFTLAVAQ